MRDQIGIPCLFMRGGTSRGPYFLASDLPADPRRRNRVLSAIMGSPDARQIDGLGGATTLTSKVAIVSKSTQEGCDVDYLFAQVDIASEGVDTEPSCGNILSGVGPFAIETGLVDAQDGETRVRIYNVNTQSRIEAIVPTPGGEVAYHGDARIDGVPGTAAPIVLNFMDVIGSVTGKLLPTGAARDVIQGVEVSCVDVAMPMILMRAADFGLTGYEGKEAFIAGSELMTRIEAIRREAGARMGIQNAGDKVVPKVGLLAPPRDGGTITSRYLTPHALHAAHAVTGGICLASACVIEGTIAHEIAAADAANPRTIWIEHPSGQIDVLLTTSEKDGALDISAGTLRTARLIMRGEVYVKRALVEADA